MDKAAGKKLASALAPPWKKIKDLNKLVAIGIGLRDRRKLLEAEAEEAGKEERDLKDYIIGMFTADQLREVKTEAGVAKLTMKRIPQIDTGSGGWDLVYAYIVSQGLVGLKVPNKQDIVQVVARQAPWDLIQKRLGERACAERWDAGVKIPGVKVFTKKDIKFGDSD